MIAAPPVGAARADEPAEAVLSPSQFDAMLEALAAKLAADDKFAETVLHKLAAPLAPGGPKSAREKLAVVVDLVHQSGSAPPAAPVEDEDWDAYLDELRAAGGDAWDSVGNPTEYIRGLRSE